MNAGRSELFTCAGGCHCGRVRFEVKVPKKVTVTHCNCSICRQTGFVHLIVSRQDFSLLNGADDLHEYRFNTGTARHYFCSTCGVKSFYVPRSHPDGYSVNLNCLELPGDVLVEHAEFDGLDWEGSIKGLLRSEDGRKKRK